MHDFDANTGNASHFWEWMENSSILQRYWKPGMVMHLWMSASLVSTHLPTTWSASAMAPLIRRLMRGADMKKGWLDRLPTVTEVPSVFLAYRNQALLFSSLFSLPQKASSKFFKLNKNFSRKRKVHKWRGNKSSIFTFRSYASGMNRETIVTPVRFRFDANMAKVSEKYRFAALQLQSIRQMMTRANSLTSSLGCGHYYFGTKSNKFY